MFEWVSRKFPPFLGLESKLNQCSKETLNYTWIAHELRANSPFFSIERSLYRNGPIFLKAFKSFAQQFDG